MLLGSAGLITPDSTWSPAGVNAPEEAAVVAAVLTPAPAPSPVMFSLFAKSSETKFKARVVAFVTSVIVAVALEVPPVILSPTPKLAVDATVNVPVVLEETRSFEEANVPVISLIVRVTPAVKF